jgi:regulatory protein NPR1
MVVPPPRAMPTELEAVSLHRLSDNLERLLDPIFLDCVETPRSSLGGGGAVGVHRYILASRSAFFLNHHG